MERTCRYGHGLLRTVADTQKNADGGSTPVVYSLMGLMKWENGALMGGSNAFVVNVHVCPVCGYVELSDYDIIEGERDDG